MSDEISAVNVNKLLREAICNLELVTYQIAELARVKEELSHKIAIMFGHEQEGNKTYIFDAYAVEVKTPYSYSVDKINYEKLKEHLPQDKNPVRESVKYDLNKEKYRELMRSGDADVAMTLMEFVAVTKPKPSITIKHRK